MRESWLVLETSDRTGSVGLFVDAALVGSRTLDPGRRPNRDLAPYCAALLADAGLKPKDVAAIAVNVGPGSYTGLRVGLISAKMFAFATGCRLYAVPSFHAVAAMVSDDIVRLDVVSDGLQGLLYVQEFSRIGNRMQPSSELRIRPLSEWMANRSAAALVGGPGVAVLPMPLPEDMKLLDESICRPTIVGVHRAAQSILPCSRDEAARLEPLYLRPSSAEETADRRAAVG